MAGFRCWNENGAVETIIWLETRARNAALKYLEWHKDKVGRYPCRAFVQPQEETGWRCVVFDFNVPASLSGGAAAS